MEVVEPELLFGLDRGYVFLIFEVVVFGAAVLTIILFAVRPLIVAGYQNLHKSTQIAKAQPATCISLWGFVVLLTLGSPILAAVVYFFVSLIILVRLPSIDTPTNSLAGSVGGTASASEKVVWGLNKYEALSLSEILVSLTVGILVLIFVIHPMIVQTAAITGRILSPKQSWTFTFATIVMLSIGVVLTNYEALSVNLGKIGLP